MSDQSDTTAGHILPLTYPGRDTEVQDIRDALLAARGFVQWPAGSAAQRRVLDLIEKALKHVPG